MANGYIDKGTSGGGPPELESGRLALTDDVNAVASWQRANESQPLVKQGGQRAVPRLAVELKISEIAPWGGAYYARLVEVVEGEFAPTDKVVEADVGEIADDATYIYVSLPEVGKGTHDIEIGSLVSGIVTSENGDGYTIVHGGTAGGGLPPLQVQGMLYMAVVDQVVGGSFLRSHAMQSI